MQFILGDLEADAAHVAHPLFSEMEELFCDEDGEMEWKETARFDLILFWKMGYLPPLFCFAFCTVDANSFFSTTMLIVDFNGIRTRERVSRTQVR